MIPHTQMTLSSNIPVFVLDLLFKRPKAMLLAAAISE
jgi:hypothetical protein